jgi:hypothetical protein
MAAYHDLPLEERLALVRRDHADAIREVVAAAPPPPEGAVDMLRRLDFPFAAARVKPPGVLHDNRISAAVGRREWKAARRSVLAQCERCGVNSTASVNGRGRVASHTVRANRSRDGWRHENCGGVLVAFDIEVGR